MNSHYLLIPDIEFLGFVNHKEALAFVERHGVVLQAARGPLPNLAEWIVGGVASGAAGGAIRAFANSRSFVYRLNKTMFFDNLPLEITCSTCAKQINETVKSLKAESRKCPFCGYKSYS
jgi:hypothetical protein